MAQTDDASRQEDGEVIDFVAQMTGSAKLRIEENLPHGFVRLKVAEAERRQAQHDIRSVEDVITELVRNSRDAGATNVVVAFQKERGRYRKITVIDDGRGIPADMHQVIFEPRVTSKRDDFEEDRYGVHGRGMALFSIRSRAMSANIIASEPGRGTVMSVVIDTKKVPERSDQATLPGVEGSEEGASIGSGPHNVARVLLEMSIDHPDMEFYLGSFAEALATSRKLSHTVDGGGPFWDDLSAITDARFLTAFAQNTLGLPVSERNAYRVLNDEVAPLVNIYRDAMNAAHTTEKVRRRLPGSPVHRGSRPLRKLSKEDMAEIGRESKAVVERVAGRYYLQPIGEPRVRRGRGKIIVSFFITGEGEED